ncbi:hypothetical protein GWI33_023369 [Rhynchophorus ferrugineus]|uniref:Uncharacterized protein n=1 Tax=Rhynchophorus ferrugineus TaxID=354439 RepID=A0A834IMA2_RHYFE|nr:hypothetical protein GWI33_023369 [Rhynchophorus ferrugineus]
MNFKHEILHMGAVIFRNKNAVRDANYDYLGPNNDFNFLQEMPTLNGLVKYLNATLNLTIYDSHGYRNYVEYYGDKKLKVMLFDLINHKLDFGGNI